MHRIDDHARQARRIEHAFLEIEIPRPALLREQLALQLIGEARHRARQVAQLFVQEGAKALEFVWRREVVGVDLFVANWDWRVPVATQDATRDGSLPGVTSVRLAWTEMTDEQRTTAMAKARFNVSQRPEETTHDPEPR